MRWTLVTGGAGFIGSQLTKRLIAEGYSVLVVDNLSTGFRYNVPKEAEFILLDISKEDFIKKLPKRKFEAIFHLAAQSSGEISFDDPLYDLKTNCLGTLMLLDWSLKNMVGHFIYTSSMSVYGDSDRQPVIETSVLSPKSFYGVGKMASEGYVNLYSNKGLNTTSLRLFNAYGPGQNMSNLRQGMVSIYMAYILKKKKVLVKGSPDRYRDFVYITDVVDAYMACLENVKSFGNTYNVGTGTKTHVRELLACELEAFGCDTKTYPIEYAEPTPGDTFGIYADISRIKKEIGWKPKIRLQDGLKIMADWTIRQK